MKIDYSQLQTFISCPRQYSYKYIQQLAKIKDGVSELDRNFGKAVHTALEMLYKGQSIEEAKKAFREGYEGIETEKAKTPANGESLIDAYYSYWQKPVNELSDTYMETVGVEIKDEFPLTDDLTYLVKIDWIVKTKAGLFAVDHKTTKKALYTFFQRFTPNMQVSGYCYYIKLKYGQCSGFIPNVLRIGYRERAYKTEPAGFHCEFERDIVNRTEEQLQDWKTNVISWSTKLQQAISANSFPKNESQCEYCSFKELCINCDDENIREVMYQKVNPLEYLK